MTERHRTDRQGWEGELLRLLVENVQDYAIFIVDARRHVLSWSYGAERLLGYREDEILGQSSDLFYTPQDVADGVPQQELEKALATARVEDDRWHVRKDGSRFRSSGVMTPLRDQAGNLRGLAKIMRDQTNLHRAEQSRKESEERNAAILETALDCIITIDHEGKILEFNPAAERTFGYRRAEALGQSMAELIVPPSLRQRHYRGLAHFLATGEGPVLGQRIEMPAMRADGSEFPVELAITSLATSGPPIFTAYLRDITESRRWNERRAARLTMTQVLAEAASLREATPRILQSVCESLEWDVGAVWGVDPAGNALRCVDVWRRPTVQAPEFEAITRQRTFTPGVGLPGRVWTTGEPAWIQDVTADGNFPRASIAAKEGLHGAFAFPLVMGQQCLGVVEFFSHQIREPDADLLEMMTTIGGQIGQFIERKRAEETLRQSEVRFRQLAAERKAALEQLKIVADSMSAPVTRCSRDLKYVWANKPYADWMGRPLEEVIGRPIVEIIGQQGFDKLLPRFEQVLAGEPVQYEDAINYRGPGVRWIHAIYTPTFDAHGAADGWVAVVIDITDRKEFEEELRHADRRKDEFLATLAHELRNPLAPIRNAVQVLKAKDSADPEVAWGRDVIDRQVQQMARLLDDLLDVSRITRNKLELRREPVALASLVERAIEASRPLIEQCGHELSVTLPREPVYLDADETRLVQVFSNLLNNAAKYTPEGGRIAITGQRLGEDVAVTVKDSGVGIEAVHLPGLFEMFSQAAPPLDRSHGGLGIGLSLVRGLVEMHGGSVEARSEGPGKGSQFIVRLPIGAERSTLEAAPLLELNGQKSEAKCRILVVDDLRDSADSMQMMLKGAGHEVRTAYEGEEALRTIEAFRPDVVLLDIGMPKLNGYEVARRIRRRPWSKSVILVAMTGWGQEEDRRSSEKAGFNYHLVKPVDAAALSTILASRRGQESNSSH